MTFGLQVARYPVAYWLAADAAADAAFAIGAADPSFDPVPANIGSTGTLAENVGPTKNDAGSDLLIASTPDLRSCAHRFTLNVTPRYPIAIGWSYVCLNPTSPDEDCPKVTETPGAAGASC